MFKPFRERVLLTRFLLENHIVFDLFFTVTAWTVQVVLHIYDLYESIKSLTTVAKTLNEKGVRSRTGKPWNPTTVRTMLTNPFYAGTYRYNYRDESSKSFTVKDEDEWVLVLDHHPAIVTPERQEQVAVILQSRQRGWVGAGMTYQRKNTHIFAGLLKCGYCGAPIEGGRPSTSAPDSGDSTTAPTKASLTGRLAPSL